MNTDYSPRGAYAPDTEKWWGEGQPAQPYSRQNRPARRAQRLPEQVKRRAYSGRARRHREQALNRTLMYMALGMLVLCLFVQVNRYAHIASQSKEILTLVNQIEELKNDQNNLKSRLSVKENLAYVRDQAMYNLGMDYPGEGQVRVVAVAADGSIPSQTAANSADLAQ